LAGSRKRAYFPEIMMAIYSESPSAFVEVEKIDDIPL
jgi:hypothetical protein